MPVFETCKMAFKEFTQHNNINVATLVEKIILYDTILKLTLTLILNLYIRNVDVSLHFNSFSPNSYHSLSL